MEQASLHGQAALVTGAASGVGAQLAERLGAAGALVGVLDWNADRVAEVTQRIISSGGRAYALLADLADARAVDTAVRRFAGCEDRLDVLVTCATVLPDRPLLAMDLAAWQTLVAVNVGGTLAATTAVAEIMSAQRYGRIVHLDPCALPVDATQRRRTGTSTLAPLTRSFALRLQSAEVTVNCVVPGPLRDSGLPGWGRPARGSVAAPARPWTSVDDVVSAVHFLASPQAGFVSGQVFHVGGTAELLPAPRAASALS
jgi:3-oxoacyl-[acyl-carrier protein] reductase